MLSSGLLVPSTSSQNTPEATEAPDLNRSSTTSTSTGTTPPSLPGIPEQRLTSAMSMVNISSLSISSSSNHNNIAGAQKFDVEDFCTIPPSAAAAGSSPGALDDIVMDNGHDPDDMMVAKTTRSTNVPSNSEQQSRSRAISSSVNRNRNRNYGSTKLFSSSWEHSRSGPTYGNSFRAHHLGYCRQQQQQQSSQYGAHHPALAQTQQLPAQTLYKAPKKAISYTELSNLDHQANSEPQYFPFHTTKLPASNVQQDLKDSVMNDMCRAVARQMVGDMYVISSASNHKVLNHLYQPVFDSIEAHFKRLPARYALSVNPDNVPMHMRLLAKQTRNSHGISIHAHAIRKDDGTLDSDVCEVVVVTNDQDHLLDAITQSIKALKGSIQDADVMTTLTGLTLDRFIIRGGGFTAEEKLIELKKRMEHALGLTPTTSSSSSSLIHSTSTTHPSQRMLPDQALVSGSPPDPAPVAEASNASSLPSEWIVPIHEISLEAPIGSGRSGQTYAAQWRGVRVAVKVINLTHHHHHQEEEKEEEEEGEQDSPADISLDILNEFYQEMKLVAKLRHPNIVLFLGAAIQPPTYCILYEYMESGALTYVLRSQKSKSTKLNFFQVVNDIAVGMNYLHCSNIVHRDLKSGNILLDSHGTAKVSDFGLSCVYHLDQHVDMTAETGTYRWMAPEVIRHETYSNTADVYSFGIVLWELLAKEQPFKGMTPIQAAFAVARQSMRPALPGYTPPMLGKFVEQCWHQDPSKRPTFRDVIQQLELIRSSFKKRDYAQLGFLVPTS